jgi:ferredoxin
MAKVIQKHELTTFLENLSNYEIYGPIEEDDVVLYRKLGKFEPLLEFTNSQKPPKEIFFPQTEKMFDFEIKGKKFIDIKEPEKLKKPLILFGVRPCDAGAFVILDKLFTWDYIDPYYVERRKRATVISLSCTNAEMPQNNCFCSSVGGSPSSKAGADMLWTDINDSYYVESLTDKGDKILKQGGKLFKDAKSDDRKKAQHAQKKAENSLVRKLNIEDIGSALENRFESGYWEQFSRRCIGCGICTILCPTCHCFDINDIVSRGKGWRERTWDSCQYPYYTIHASGYNPRPEKKHRQRNRIYHKFLYMKKNLDVLGCVGCGRCISQCPVNIDIIEVAEGIMEITS